jgi:soluble lytic murein transglycosylase-like protein
MRLLNSFLLVLCCAALVTAQQRYSFDNFDAQSGVRVAKARTTDSLSTAKAATAKSPAKDQAAKKNLNAKNSPTTKSRFDARIKPVIYTPLIGAGSLADFTTGNPKIDSCIVDSGKRNGVDPALLYSIMHQESSFKTRAVSYKGASGLMQLMPGTATRFGVRDRFDPQQSVEGGARYVRFLLDYFGGDVNLALAGYNAGEGAVLRYGRRIPPYRETQDYVRRISKRYALMRDPNALRSAPRATLTEIAKVEPPVPTVAPPPPSYEREVFAVRLPDGKLRLVSQ